MEAGRELDALIAEKVMGYPAFAEKVVTKLGDHLVISDHCAICGRKDGTSECLPHYSTDIAAAWEVVEKLRLSVLQFEDGWFADPRLESYREHFWGALGADDFSATAPLAICRAALEAVGHGN